MEMWNRVYMMHGVYSVTMLMCVHDAWSIYITMYINIYVNLCICIWTMNTNPYTNMVPTLLSFWDLISVLSIDTLKDIKIFEFPLGRASFFANTWLLNLNEYVHVSCHCQAILKTIQFQIPNTGLSPKSKLTNRQNDDIWYSDAHGVGIRIVYNNYVNRSIGCSRRGDFRWTHYGSLVVQVQRSLKRSLRRSLRRSSLNLSLKSPP